MNEILAKVDLSPNDNNADLKCDWEISTLGKIASYIQRGKSPKYTEYSDLAVINQKCIRWNGIDRTHVKYIHPDQFDKFTEERFLRNGDVLWNSTGTGTIGRAAIVQLKENEKLVADSHVTIVRANSNTDPRYIHYWIMGPKIQNSIEDMQSGSTNQVELSKKAVESTPIPLAPLDQQKQIVAKIEELFSHIDAGVVALQKAKKLLKQYRQSVLKAAVTGELTREWRKQNKDKLEPASELLKRILAERRNKWEEQQLEQFKAQGKVPKDDKWKGKYKEPKILNLDSQAKVPKEWLWVTWEFILDFKEGSFKRGPFGSALKKEFFVDSGFKVYEQYCPINDDCSFSRYYITGEKFKELKGFSVGAGDFLISCSGVTLGRITQVPAEYEKGVINQALLRVRTNKDIIDDAYFKMLFRSPYFQQQIFDNVAGVAIPNVKGVNELKAIPLPLPPKGEQIEIYKIVELKMSALERLETEITKLLKNAEKNKQSILATAFSGQLLKENNGEADQ